MKPATYVAGFFISVAVTIFALGQKNSSSLASFCEVGWSIWYNPRNLDPQIQQRLVEYLAEYITSPRKELIEQVLVQRTRHLTLVMEDIDKPHNAGAVLRTADCFGIQDVHVVEETTKYKHSQKVTRGASKWLTLHRYDQESGGNTQRCIESLKAKGYQFLVTSPNAETEGFQHVDFSTKVAVLFGTEWFGASEYAMSQADGLIKLPMYGFTESFNISVAAALTLQGLVNSLRSSKATWQLSEQERNALRLEWYRNSVRNPDIMEREFLEKQGGTV
ncbi:MAG TPA: rRNA methyltransferase [Cytophagales bacterium]|nr:rRNA methyltransferase [Cytophagales bacterium]HAA17256.1 rRNA methyltransferase [Cytophagales bacterium]HAP60499.1 rRNA methyltransferase [Cytophagales bacterium]